MTIRELCKLLVPDCNVKIVCNSDFEGKFYMELRPAGDIVSDSSEFYELQVQDLTLYKDYFDILC